MARRFHGLGVSPGVALGRASLLYTEPLPVVPDPIPPERVDEEIERFHRACRQACEELDELRSQIVEELGQPYAGILDAQKLILEDPSLLGATVQRIRIGRVSARWALRETVAEFTRRFDAVADEYLRERGGELSDVHRRLQRLLGGMPLGDRSQPGPGRVIVIAPSLGPSDAILLAGRSVAGLAADAGGRTSHTAILAQALCLPAVVGLHDFSQHVRAGDELIVDGDRGLVVLEPNPAETAAAEEQHRAWRQREDAMASERDLPVVTQDGVEVVIRANIEFPGEVPSALRYGARGIGLYRSEFLFLSMAPRLPTEDEHYETYREIAQLVAPHPAVVRTLDLGGEKYFQEVLQSRDSNPVLGLRAIRFCLKRPEIFRPQLRGLLRAAARQENLRIMLPLITSTEEVREVRRLLAEEAEKLKADGQAARGDVPLGIMIEIPAAAAAADILAREADFFSIGTNDLVQYALAVDRSNEMLAELYQPLHPGVLRLLRSTVSGAADCGIPVALCGEMATDEEACGLLIGLGIRELSVPPRAVARVRSFIRRLDAARAQQRVHQALEPAAGAARCRVQQLS